MYGTVWSNSKYVYIAVYVHGCYWCSINVVRGRNLTLTRYFVVETHFNNDHGSALISNECMERCCVDIGKTARTFVSLRVCTGVIGVQLM